MRLPEQLLQKLKYSVDIDEIRNYFNIIETEYSHLHWSWDKSDTIVEQWKTEAYKDPANLLTSGYAIQSNLVDLNLPCPPWNISTLPTTDYRNTVLSFGIVKELQEKFSYGYRWAISIQQPGGKVTTHSDQEDEFTVWLPIYTKGPAITFVKDTEVPVMLPSDGSMYLLDTTVPHYTYNNSDKVRVALLFRINEQYEKTILETI